MLAASPAEAASNDWVVNLSLGGAAPTATPCTSGTPPTYGLNPASQAPTNQAFIDAINLLTNRGVPVIAAAGNEGVANGLSWPACLPGTIKVSSAINPASTVHVVSQFFANLVPVGTGTAFAADYLMIATGGGSQEGDVYSALANNGGGLRYGASAGTSYAAPHVVGAYAVVKAGFRKLGIPWTVSDGSAYLYGTASVNATWTNPNNASDTRTYRSIRFVAPPP